MTNFKDNADKTLDVLTGIIDNLFSKHFKKDKKAMQVEPQPASTKEQTETPVYASIEDYTSTTGKRFRMTKDQKSRQLSRETAFAETYGDTLCKTENGVN
jgi:hypothetical protein